MYISVCIILMSKLKNSRQQQPATLKWASVRQMNIASQGLNIVLDCSYTGAWLYGVGKCFEAPINKIYRYIEQLKCDLVLWQKLWSDESLNWSEVKWWPSARRRWEPRRICSGRGRNGSECGERGTRGSRASPTQVIHVVTLKLYDEFNAWC